MKRLNSLGDKCIVLLIGTILLSHLILESCNDHPTSSQPIGPWLVFNKTNSPLVTDHIKNLFIDYQQRVWIATDSGAFSYNASTRSWARIKDSLLYYLYDNSGNAYPGYAVTSITDSKDGSIWFALRGGGVRRFNQSSQTGKVWTRYTSQVPAFVSGIVAYKNDPSGYGEIWVSSSTGIDRYHQTGLDDGTWAHFDPTTTISFPTNNIVSAFVSRIDDNLWFGGSSGGAINAYYNDINLIWDKYESPTEQFAVKAIAIDLNKTVWFGKSVGASSLNLTSNKWTYFIPDSTNGQFPAGATNAIVTNYHNVRWFGTDSGLVILENTTFTRYTHNNSELPNDKLTSLALDLHGNLWIGTEFGLAVYRKEGIIF